MRLSLELSVFSFLQWYRGYLKSKTDNEFLERIQDKGEDTPERFRQLLRALAKSCGINESLVENLKENPSLDGLIPISAVWPRKPCDSQEVSLGEISFQYRVAQVLIGADLELFSFAGTQMFVSKEHALPRPIFGY
jgi:hypothetical protein